jgi:hypothetical protein
MVIHDGELRVLRFADGALSVERQTPMAFATGVRAADLDGDTDLDIVVSRFDSATAIDTRVLLNDRF